MLKKQAGVLRQHNIPNILLRPYQAKFYDAFFSGLYNQFILLCARRTGKDVASFSACVAYAMLYVDIYFYCMPSKDEVGKAILRGKLKDGKPFLDLIPSIYVKKVDYSGQFLVLHHPKNYQKLEAGVKLTSDEYIADGSIIYFVGLDRNPDIDRGSSARGMVLSEFGFMKSPEVLLTYIPMIIERNGWIIYNSTPNGMNHFYDLWVKVQEQKRCGAAKKVFTQKVQVMYSDEDGYVPDLIPITEVHEVSDLLGYSSSKIEQEFGCRFIAVSDGSIFGSEIDKIIATNRLTELEHHQDKAVHVSFDIGYTDATACWFFQIIDGKYRFIDYYQNASQPIEHYVKMLQTFSYENNYTYGDMILPHDAAANTSVGSSYQTQMTKLLKRLGVRARIKICKRTKIHNSIYMARSKMKDVYFDIKLQENVKSLSLYRFNYNELTRSLSRMPVHDEHSHCADSFRYAMTAVIDNSLGGYCRSDDWGDDKPKVIKIKQPKIKWNETYKQAQAQ